MKRTIFAALIALCLLPVSARAQTWQIAQMIIGHPCSGVPITGVVGNSLCIDSTNNSIYYPGSSGWTMIANGGMSPSFTSVALNGSVSGTATIAPSATTTSYTQTLKSAVPAQGDILDYSNATGQQSSLADVALGSVLASGGVGAVPTYTANPAVSTVVLNGSTSGTTTLSANASAITSYTLTYPAAAPSQGALQTYSNSTGSISNVPDVATGSVLASGGVNTAPAYGGVPAGAFTAQSSVAAFYRTYQTGSAAAVVSNSAANFFPFSGVLAPVASTLEGDVSTIAPLVSTIKNMTCVLTTAAGVVTVAGGTSYVMALRQNIASSAVTCTIATGASTCTDSTHSITTAVGDQLDYIDTPSGTPTALVVKCSSEVDI